MKHLLLTLLLAAANLASAQVTMTIDTTLRSHHLNPYQYGLFFEEINHAGEGGLYAEMVQARSFGGNEREMAAWRTIGNSKTQIVTTGLLNAAQTQAMQVTATQPNTGIANTGFWGMAVNKGETYTLTFYAKGNARITAALRTKSDLQELKNSQTQSLNNSQPPLASARVSVKGKWAKYTLRLTPTASSANACLTLTLDRPATVCLDVVSLFPETFRGRPNGLRKDLAQALADLHPTFLRFPGGCYVEGVNSYDEAFQWKKTIGPIENRPGHHNRNWGYTSTDGLGFDEYLQFCEDIGAAPMYVVNVGLGHEFQIPLEDIDTLIQSTLDAIEYANGPVTTTWGALRAKHGHPAPYNLRFIEIGNENYQADARIHSQDYAERYIRFYQAIKRKYPDIITIGNVDAWGHDNPLWLNLHPVEILDEHYYRNPSWMIENYTKYDNRMRNFVIYNGEYAANSEGKGLPNILSAIAESIYMLGMERNSDICQMASFAPLLMNVNDPRWKYDLIYHNHQGCYLTPSYYVQQMLATNVGKQNLLWTETGNEITNSETQKLTNSETQELNNSQTQNLNNSQTQRLIYQSIAIDDNARTIYLKLANPHPSAVNLNLQWANVAPTTATLIQLASPQPTDTNSFEHPDAVCPTRTELSDVSHLILPPYSLSICQVHY